MLLFIKAFFFFLDSNKFNCNKLGSLLKVEAFYLSYFCVFSSVITISSGCSLLREKQDLERLASSTKGDWNPSAHVFPGVFSFH